MNIFRKTNYVLLLGVNVVLSFLLYSDWVTTSFLTNIKAANVAFGRSIWDDNDNAYSNSNSTLSSFKNASVIPSLHSSLRRSSIINNNNNNMDNQQWIVVDSNTINSTGATSSNNNNDDSSNNNNTPQIDNTDDRSSQRSDIIVPIIVDLTGELGNHLLHIAHGRILQIMAQDLYGISTELILRQTSNAGKYQSTRYNLQNCFPILRNMTFYQPHDFPKDIVQQTISKKNKEGKSKHPIRARQEELWNGMINGQQEGLAPWYVPTGSDYDATRQVLDQLAQIVTVPATLEERSLRGGENYKSSPATTTIADEDSLLLRAPFLQTTNMINRQFMDLFYDELRDFFVFDDERCCADLPHPGETVFHFRNFVGELKKKGKSTGLEELSPAKTANELLAMEINHHHHFDNSNSNPIRHANIVIATRNANDPTTQQYVQALLDASSISIHHHPSSNATTSSSSTDNNNNIQRRRHVRIFTNHSAVQDFCAMRHATELVGTVRSTFVVWAALLGQPNQTARLYSVDSLMARKRSARKQNAPIFRTYNWTHPELQRRIHFELYQAEDVE